MKMRNEILTIAQLVERLKNGGWVIVGGREARGFAGATIKNAHYEKSDLVMATTNGTVGVGCMRIRKIAPWNIMVDSLYPTVQARHAAKGGGTHEVPALQDALHLHNPRLQVALEREARNRLARQREEAETRDKEQRETRRVALEADFNRQFAGKIIVGIQIGQGGMCIVFTDGSNMNISIDGGDTYDAWVNVNDMSLTDYVPSDS